jgi:hypothetical protein
LKDHGDEEAPKEARAALEQVCIGVDEHELALHFSSRIETRFSVAPNISTKMGF